MKINVLDLLYPPKCVFCRDILRLGKEEGICRTCSEEIEYITGEICPMCGKPVGKPIKACHECRSFESFFTRNYALFAYEGMVREAIHRFKYKRNPQYGKYFAKAMTQKFHAEITAHDFLIAIPMYHTKMKRRGFNQADILAKEISALTGVPTLDNVLIRTKDTKAQQALNRAARFNNLSDAFALTSDEHIKGKKILLVDDIFTTGTTINKCAKILNGSAAELINSLTISVVEEEQKKDEKKR